MEFLQGFNCWRMDRADRFSVIVDGKSYFRALRQALLQARQRVFMIGWDFDFGIEMLPGESDGHDNAPDGFPNRIGPFLDALADHNPDLNIYMLQWSGGVLLAPGQVLPSLQMKFLSPDQVHLAFDGRHPVGACHHQKVVAIDDVTAFCGGIDVTDGRWDDRDHLTDNPQRRLLDGEIAQPWHDAAVVLDGPAAHALSELARSRWARANGKDLGALPASCDPIWPDSIKPDFTRITVAIARTEPPESDRAAINEIETLYLDAISSAKDYLYFESQYFCSDKITDALARRLREEDGPEVIVINPFASPNSAEDIAMNIPRNRMIQQLAKADHHGRFAIYYPVTRAEEPIYVHAKILISDDRFLRVGSSNIDRRSMGFDTECDVALLAEDTATSHELRTILLGLIAEHLDRDANEIDTEVAKTKRLIATIEQLNRPSGRRLRRLEQSPPSPIKELLAETRFFDPRYRSSAKARTGITARHLIWGAALAVAATVLWKRRKK